MAASVRKGRTGNLPAEANAFVGRKGELAAVSGLLDTNRLVTLTGPGGVGKSRLALRAADLALEDFPGGVWLVELSELQDPGLLTNAVAQATRLAEQTLLPLLEALSEHLARAPLLLVLDTCEHVLDECARVVQELLARVPELHVLATSRRAVGGTGRASADGGTAAARRTGRRGGAVRDARRRGRAVLRADRRQPRGRGRRVRPSRRDSAGPGAGGGAPARLPSRPAPGGPGLPLRTAGLARPAAARPASDTAYGDRLEPRAVHPAGAAALGPAVGLHAAAGTWRRPNSCAMAARWTPRRFSRCSRRSPRSRS